MSDNKNIEMIIKFVTLILSISLLWAFFKSNEMIGFYLLLSTILVVITIKLLYPKNKNNQKEIITQDSIDNMQDFDIKPIKSNYSFNDIGGFETIKDDIYEIVDYINNPLKYKKLDINMPKGILLVGSPGVGKTLIAKALANELNVPFFYQSGASFVHKYVGVGASRVRELFNRAKISSPSIIFIDEIDSIAKNRDDMGSDERESTLNELLTQMDGFSSDDNTIVIGATNRVDVLDNAILRAGRFDRRIHISLPNFEDRESILLKHLAKKTHNIDISQIAKATSGFSGAQLQTLINESALYALKNKESSISSQSVLKMINRVKNGIKTTQHTTSYEIDIVSIYKASKAIYLNKIGYDYDKLSMLEDDILLDENKILSSNTLNQYIGYYLIGSVSLQEIYSQSFTYGYSDIKIAKRLLELLNKIDDTKVNIKSIKQEIKSKYLEYSLKIKEVAQVLKHHESITKEEINEIL